MCVLRICSLLMVMVAAGLVGRGHSHAATRFVPKQNDPVTEQWRWRMFQELNGLGVRCMVEDTEGAIWFGLDRGLTRFDGITWTPADVHDREDGRSVNSICLTTDGRVVAGTECGVFILEDGTWVELTPTMREAAWSINNLRPGANGSVWAATGWEVLHLDGNRATLLTSEARKRVIERFGYDGAFQIVPKWVLRRSVWGSGLGVALAEGTWLGIDRGASPVAITAIADGGPADRAGIKVGDVLVEVDGRRSILKQHTDAQSGTVVNVQVRSGSDGELRFASHRLRVKTFRVVTRSSPALTYSAIHATDSGSGCLLRAKR